MIQKLALPLLADSDIVVIGGGPAGFAAALAARRRGGKVLLLEQSTMFGGLGTAGLVPMFSPTYDGDRMLYGGIFAELNKEMCRRMEAELEPRSWQAINPEILKRLYDEMAEEAGFDFVFGAKLCEVEVADGRIEAVLIATSQGLKRVTGRMFIDGTGDALLAAMAGAGFEYGDENGKTMSPTLCAQFSNIDFDEVEKSHAKGISGISIWHKLQEEGRTPFKEHHFVCMKQVNAGTATSNLGHVYGLDCLDEFELTKGYVVGRRIAAMLENFYREHVPGFQHADLVNTASLLGVRETRRIKGEYRMTFDDYVRRAVFEDEIGRCCYPVDIHSSSTDPEEQKRVEEVLRETRFQHGESYGIPYRALIPIGLKNLLVPGRALSCDRSIQSSLRVMPPCYVTGQAAGVAAALAKEDVRDVDMAELRAGLRHMGAIFQ